MTFTENQSSGTPSPSTDPIGVGIPVLAGAKTLAQVQASLEHGVFSGARARSVGRQIAAALRRAADAGIIVRNITAQQIFLADVDSDVGGDLVLIDFAACAALPARTGITDDVQLLGLLLYEMVVGKPATSLPNEAPPDPALARLDLDIPSDLDALIMRALDPVPRKRWPNVSAMLAVLAAGEQQVGARGTGSSANDDNSFTERQDIRLFGRTLFPRPSRGAMVSGGVAGVATLVLIGALLTSRGDVSARETAQPARSSAMSRVDPGVSGMAPAAKLPLVERAPVTPPPTTATGIAKGEGCAVTLGSEPWSEVWIDGKWAGYTLLVQFPVPCGPHSVVFRSKEWNMESRVTIVAQPKKVYTKVVRLTVHDTRAAFDPAPR